MSDTNVPAARGGLTPGLVLALVAAIAFAFGAGGFALGSRAAEPPAADVGFLRDMIVHHEQAVEMSKIVINGDLPEGARSFVLEVISDQRYEIGLMETTLRRWNVTTEAEAGEAMAWMGDPVDADAMPGMASSDDLKALSDATGNAAAEQWFQLMSVHHQGGQAMAQAAIEKVSDDQVRALAERIARNQRIEINEYAAAAERLGITAPALGPTSDAPGEQGGHP